MKDFIEGEIWKDAVGYEGLYEVSNLGRVYSLPKTWKAGVATRNHFGIILNGKPNKRGYKIVHLRKDSKDKCVPVHRMVALAFLEQNGKDTVDHINNIKDDNHAINLRWCTQKENALFDNYVKRRPIGKGAYYIKKRKEWATSIQVNKKQIFLGYFKNEEDAKNKYFEAVELYCPDKLLIFQRFPAIEPNI